MAMARHSAKSSSPRFLPIYDSKLGPAMIRERLNHIFIDSTGSATDLCLIGGKENTDKSPYSAGHHRHPYTAVYDLLFGFRRFEALVIGEVGVAQNASMRMWRAYFPRAELFGFDFDETLISKARAENIAGVKYQQADITSRVSLSAAFHSAQKPFDVIIDDSTHHFEHQVGFLPVAIRYSKPGAMIIIEDVFRPWSEKRYIDKLAPYLDYFVSGTFIDCGHALKKSDGHQEPYYDNDKLLVLLRSERPGSEMSLDFN